MGEEGSVVCVRCAWGCVFENKSENIESQNTINPTPPNFDTDAKDT